MNIQSSTRKNVCAAEPSMYAADQRALAAEPSMLTEPGANALCTSAHIEIRQRALEERAATLICTRGAHYPYASSGVHRERAFMLFFMCACWTYAFKILFMCAQSARTFTLSSRCISWSAFSPLHRFCGAPFARSLSTTMEACAPCAPQQQFLKHAELKNYVS